MRLKVACIDSESDYAARIRTDYAMMSPQFHTWIFDLRLSICIQLVQLSTYTARRRVEGQSSSNRVVQIWRLFQSSIEKPAFCELQHLIRCKK